MYHSPIVGFISPPQWYDPTPIEFSTLCGPSVRVQQTIMDLPNFSFDDLSAIAAATDKMAHAASQLRQAGASAVAFNGTPFTWAGLSSEAQIRERSQRIADTSGCPFIMPGTAMIDAIRAHGAKRIAIFAPYYTQEWLQMTAKAFRAFECDVAVAASASDLGLVTARTSIDDHEAASSPDIVQAALHRLATDHKGIEAIAIPGTGVRTLAMTPMTEAELGLPVIGADTATYWAVAETLGLTIRHRLFSGLTAHESRSD